MQKKVINNIVEFEDWLKKEKEISVVFKTDLTRYPREYPCMIVWTTIGLSDSKFSRATFYGFIYPRDTVWEQ